MNELIERAARIVAGADALLVTAGAGMGVDSGLPDFRGDEGFWAAYPPFRALGLSFAELANPHWFEADPSLAWGFYGHRLGLYRTTQPHAGFEVLRRWVARAKHGGFVFTSNVDGAFQRAGFDPERVVECHGSIHHMQCTKGCGYGLREATGVDVEVDPSTFRAVGTLPTCPGCGALLRPNILMFGDGAWDPSRTFAQESSLEHWQKSLATRGARLCVVECGAGSAIPTVRSTSERTARSFATPLIRINLREPHGPDGTTGLALGARAALEAIDRSIGG
jgi:NAD-dependent SIR2 family protein deacetylase